MFTRKIIEIAGMVVAVAALGQLPAHAAVNLDTGAGSVTYAKETLTTATVTGTADSETYHTVSAPDPSGRLSFRAQVGRAVAGGGVIQVRFNLGNMVFAGATAPVLSIAGVTPTIALVGGGAQGDAQARFTITAGASEPIAATAMMTLTVRSLAVLVDQAGTVRMGTRAGMTGAFTFTSDEGVTAVRVASGLREEVTPASPVVKFADGFRSFAGKLAASVGHLLVGPPPGTGASRVFVAASSSPAILSYMISSTDSDSTVTFSGDLGFTSDAFLSDAADCSTKDEEGVLGSGGTWAPVNLVAANDKHLCIEVDGVTSIPATTAYQAAVSYGGITSAAFPPGDANLVLGKMVREGVSVYLPYVNTHPNVNFRVVIVNRMDEPVPYNFEFNPPDGTSAVGGAQAEGTLPANSLNVLRAATVVTVSGRRTYTSASLTVGASPEMVEIMAVQTNRSNGNTDTVRYWPEE